MTDQPPPPPELEILGARASAALATALRTKKQNVVPIVIKHENDIHSFSPENWMALAVARAAGIDSQFSLHGGQYLAPLFTDATGWGPDEYQDHLKQLAGTLADNLAHPMELDQDVYRYVQTLYALIPQHLREAAFVDAATNHL